MRRLCPPSLLSLLALSFCPDALATQIGANDRIAPGGVQNSGVTQIRQFGPTYLFSHDDGNGGVTYYGFDPGSSEVAQGYIDVWAAVPGGLLFKPVSKGSVRYRQSWPQTSSGQQVVIDDLPAAATTTLVNQQFIADRRVDLFYSDVIDGVTLHRRHRFEMEGSVLKIQLDWVNPDGSMPTPGTLVDVERTYCGFIPGGSLNTNGAFDFEPPLSRWPVGVFQQDGEERFFGAYIDPTQSTGLGVRTYRNPNVPGLGLGIGTQTESLPDTARQVVPMHEVLYVAASKVILDVAPLPLPDTSALPYSASAYRDDLIPRVFFDFNTQGGRYLESGGMEIGWQASASGTADVRVDFDVQDSPFSPFATFGSLEDCTGESEVRLQIRRKTATTEVVLLDELVDSLNPMADVRTVSISVDAGDSILFRMEAAGLQTCDMLTLAPVVTLNATADNAALDFPNGPWTYKEFFRDQKFALVDNGNGLMVANTAPGLLAGVGTTMLQTSSGPVSALFAIPPIVPYESSEQWLIALANAGMKDLSVLYRNWHKSGFGIGMPEMVPADSLQGTQVQFQSMIDRAKNYGFRIALLEIFGLNWLNLPTCGPAGVNPYYNGDPSESIVAKDSFGDPSLYDYASNTNGCDAWLALDQQIRVFNGDIPPPLTSGGATYDVYGTNSMWFDGQTATLPGDSMDLDAAKTNVEKTDRQAFVLQKELMAEMHVKQGGPLFGESGDKSGTRFDTYYAGYVDSTARQLIGRKQSYSLPDFELEAVRPWMASNGVAPYERYFPLTNAQTIAIADQPDFDRYRVQTLLYAHGGYLGDYIQTSLGKWLDMSGMMRFYADEYYLMRAVQEQVLDLQNTLQSVSYEFGTGIGPLTLSEALSMAPENAALDLKSPRISIDYSDLSVRANMDQGFVAAVSPMEFSSVQGMHGWNYRSLTGSQASPLTFVAASDEYRVDPNNILAGFVRASETAASDTSSVERVYTFSTSGDYVATITVDPLGAEEGVIEVFLNGAMVAGQTVSATTVEWDPWVQSIPVTASASDELIIRFSPVLGDAFVSFYTNIVIEPVASGSPSTWTTSLGGQTYELPLYGYAVDGVDLTAFSAIVNGKHIDYVDAEDYEYLRARDGSLTSNGTIKTDGSAAFVESPHSARPDVHAFAVTRVGRPSANPLVRLRRDGQLLRGDIQVINDGPQEIRFLPNYFETGLEAEVTYRDLPILTLQQQQSMVLLEEDPAGFAHVKPFQTPSASVLKFSGARAGWTYRLTW